METKDNRNIISGFHSTEKERKAALNPVQWEKWKELEQKIAMRDTGTINIVKTKNQNRIHGTAENNPWGHKEGDIGNTIDYCIELGIFTKDQIATLAGSKINKVNSHINHLEKEKGFKVIVNNNDIVSFQDAATKIKNQRNLSAPEELNKYYLPTKEDCDRAINDLQQGTTVEVLDRIEKNVTSQGFILKSNWRIITEENMKIWSC